MFVEEEKTYTVAVYLAGSGGTYLHLNLPQTHADIKIEASTFEHTGSNPDAIPVNDVSSFMFGQADIGFVPFTTD